MLEIPYQRPLQDIYLPSDFSSEEYPNLVPQGSRVDTVAVSTMLLVYNWPLESDRYRRVARFVDALFDKLPLFRQPPRHPKWRDTVISTNIPGLERFRAAQDWLDRSKEAMPASPPPARAEEFDRIVVQRNSGRKPAPEDAAKVYSDFLRWRDGQR